MRRGGGSGLTPLRREKGDLSVYGFIRKDNLDVFLKVLRDLVVESLESGGHTVRTGLFDGVNAEPLRVSIEEGILEVADDYEKTRPQVVLGTWHP